MAKALVKDPAEAQPEAQAKARAEAQAQYMSYLIKRAKNLAIKRVNEGLNLDFDPQGRVLVDVTLTNEELGDRALALGIKITKTTTVSLDCTSDNVLKRNFEDQLKAALKKYEVADIALEQLIAKLNVTPKGSIIALQQEFHFHLALVARVYNKHAKLSDEKLREIHDQSMAKVNEEVINAYAKALKDSYGVNSIDVAKLNMLLDKARKEILPEAHKLMAKELITELPLADIANQQKIKALSALSASQLKHEAEKITATPNDILHLDNEQGLATLIEGSDQTAHNKSKGKDFAHRQLITHNLIEEDVKAKKDSPFLIRTASISAATTRIFLASSEATYVEDVVLKLDELRTRFKLNEYLKDYQVKPRAFTYNLLTAINHTLDDLQGKNLQSQSAIHILKGAHAHNALQLENNANNPVLCYVQNISVNGFGDELGYDTTFKSLVYAIFNREGNKLRKEATLMTELSMLNTIYDVLPNDQKTATNDIISYYKDFLKNKNREQFFSDSPEGNKAIKAINAFKMNFKINPQELSENLNTKAKRALRNLMHNNLHFKHDFAKLTQSLSIFCGDSLISCKSGNERTQAIIDRYEIFQSLEKQPLIGDRKDVADALTSLAHATTTLEISKCTEALNTALNMALNNKNLQGAASLISLVDQGAPAKVEAQVNFSVNPLKAVEGLVNANYGEENAAIMTNLHQANAGPMQAHKKMGKHMQQAFAAAAKAAAEAKAAAKPGAGPSGDIVGSPSAIMSQLNKRPLSPSAPANKILDNKEEIAQAPIMTNLQEAKQMKNPFAAAGQAAATASPTSQAEGQNESKSIGPSP